jgi:hypothetical protein
VGWTNGLNGWCAINQTETERMNWIGRRERPESDARSARQIVMTWTHENAGKSCSGGFLFRDRRLGSGVVSV